MNRLGALLTSAALLVVQRGAAAPLRWGADAEGGAPYVFADPKDPSRRIGFEVEIADALARELGEPVVFTQYDFRSLVDGIERGDLDLAMNGLEATSALAARVRFSRPYYAHAQQLVVRADERRFDDVTGCAAANGTVGTLELTGADRFLSAHGIRAKRYDGQREPYVDLELGRVDAVLLDLPVALHYAKPNRRLRLAGAPFAPGVYAIATARSNTALAERVDRALESLARSGALRAIHERWGLWNVETEALFRTFATPAPLADGSVPPIADDGRPLTANGVRAATSLDASGVWSARAYLPLLLEGASVTLFLACASMVGALVLALPIALARLHGPRVLQVAAGAYVEFFRGVPVLLVLYFLYYGLPVVASRAGLPFSLRLEPTHAALVGFVLNYAAYEAEVQRAGLLSVPQGQRDAAASLGLTPLQTFRYVVAPQALRAALPAMTNDFVALFKETSVVSVIAVVELAKQYQMLAKSSLAYLEIGLATAAIYLALSVPLGLLARRLEHRWSKGR